MIAEKKQGSDNSEVLMQSSRTDIDKSTSTFQQVSVVANDAVKQANLL